MLLMCLMHTLVLPQQQICKGSLPGISKQLVNVGSSLESRNMRQQHLAAGALPAWTRHKLLSETTNQRSVDLKGDAFFELKAFQWHFCFLNWNYEVMWFSCPPMSLFNSNQIDKLLLSSWPSHCLSHIINFKINTLPLWGVLDFLTVCQAADWKMTMIEGKENWQFPRLNCETLLDMFFSKKTEKTLEQ